ncbi:MAG: hypothetical protein OXN84_01170 [Albidovulum sp.]|nr:hypothetical protein [Albidovulum sp.]
MPGPFGRAEAFLALGASSVLAEIGSRSNSAAFEKAMAPILLWIE